ncbi:MAG: DnaJ domain-containing protein [Campylobacterota bacterium]|nr:DnaJ domain-containing protein [Campylobacterota bacterium]
MGNLIIYAIVGYILYRIYKSYRRFEKVYYRQEFKNMVLTKEHLETNELGLFVALTAKLAKADGRVDELEAELVSNMFNDISRVFPDQDHAKSLLKEIFNQEKDIKFNFDEKAHALRATLRGDERKVRDMLGFWINLAFIDGSLSHAEENMLYKLAAFLHVDEATLHSMIEQFKNVYKNSHVQSSIDDAYKLLGVSKDSSLGDVKKAYRKLVKQYHPDIVKAQGADEAYMQEATQKVQEVNAAYEQIKKIHS